jgi:hypothetical protein
MSLTPHKRRAHGAGPQATRRRRASAGSAALAAPRGRASGGVCRLEKGTSPSGHSQKLGAVRSCGSEARKNRPLIDGERKRAAWPPAKGRQDPSAPRSAAFKADASRSRGIWSAARAKRPDELASGCPPSSAASESSNSPDGLISSRSWATMGQLALEAPERLRRLARLFSSP